MEHHKTNMRWLLAVIGIVIVSVLVTCYRMAQSNDVESLPADSAFEEILEQEGVHPHFPKSPKTKVPHNLD